LAVDGDKESVDALYEHAGSLYKRDPDSAAAAEGAFTLVQLAFSNSTAAIMTGTAAKDPRWLQEFARQAEAYALKFPNEEKRAIPLLFTAAETCELNGLAEEAVRAYSVIAQRFPKHPAAEVSVTILRRLKMRGKRIKLSGTSLQGEKLSLEQFAGKPIVVFFWSTEAQPAVKQIPEVADAVKKHGQNLAVIGVCLDEKQETLEEFLSKQKLPWPNIFNTDAEKRAWNNPIVKFYGVRRIPAIWVIDAAGRIIATEVPAGQLDAQLSQLNSQRTAAQPRNSRSKN
jgi:peroxiredoxin